ncbi:MAG: hypothetical protein PHP59_02990 [Methanofollis sp.]|uniref:hypothetical protein n=1 Tax=Methanofollis sp. TaxID=2052835 RepID=UPI002601FDEF|nr:hypothetical protein [Methanofollis sp.]MDD4254322.1 hypothetical protein [Methanofollis sp.]
MHHRTGLALIIGLIVLVCAATAGSTSGVASQVSVTKTNIEPGSLMPGDIATVSIEVTNGGTDAVQISRAFLEDTMVPSVGEQVGSNVGTLGAGAKRTFTYTVKAGTNTHTGTYYPWFYLDFGEGGSLSTHIPVPVDETPVTVLVTSRPDSFVEGKKEHIQLVIGNPRSSEISGVSVVPVGDGIEAVQTGHFAGAIPPSGTANLTFDLTATKETTLGFEVTYRTGTNTHTTRIEIPVVFGDAKTMAHLVVNNIEVKGGFGSYSIGGDVTNAGLTTARGVVVTTGDPAVPENPYPEYVLGSLEADDLSSFDLNCRVENATEIPLLISFRDADGTLYTQSTTVSLDKAGGYVQKKAPEGAENADAGLPLPVIAILGVLAILACGLIVKKTGLIDDLRNSRRP